MTDQMPAPTNVARPNPIVHWEVMPAESDTLSPVHTVTRYIDPKYREIVSIHHGRIGSQNATTLRFGPETARLLGQALLAAAGWTDSGSTSAELRRLAKEMDPSTEGIWRQAADMLTARADELETRLAEPSQPKQVKPIHTKEN